MYSLRRSSITYPPCVQIGYSVSLLLGLLHDTILAAPPPGAPAASALAPASGGGRRRRPAAAAASPRGASSAPIEAGGVEWADPASAADGTVVSAAPSSPSSSVSLAQLATMASVLLAVVQHVQVVLELVALRKGGLPARHRMVVTVEATKFLLRMIILAHRQTTLLDGGAYSAPLPEEGGASGAAGNTTTNNSLTGNSANAAMGGFGPGYRLGSAQEEEGRSTSGGGGGGAAVKETYVGRRSGRAMTFANSRSSQASTAGTPRHRKNSNAATGGATDNDSIGGGSGSGSGGGGGSRSSLENEKRAERAPEQRVGSEEGQARPAWLDAPAVDLDANRGPQENGEAEVGNSTTRNSGSVAARWQRSAATVIGPGSALWRAFHLNDSSTSTSSSTGCSEERPEDSAEEQRARLAALAVRWNLAAEVLYFARPLVQVILK